MKYDEDNEWFILSTGKKVFAKHGYPTNMIDILEMRGPYCALTTEERREIAEHMINLWKEWGNNALGADQKF